MLNRLHRRKRKGKINEKQRIGIVNDQQVQRQDL